MNNKYPNPWDFSNIDSNLISSKKGYKIEYGETNEIAMGGPLGGECYLISKDGGKIKLSDWAGGPAIWNETGNKVAIPIWTPDRNQKIKLIDIENHKVIVFSRKFRVLDLERFDKNLIVGIDSPIFKSAKVKFDIEKERIVKQMILGEY